MRHERPRFYQPPNNGVPPPERGGFRVRATVTRPPDRERIPTPTIPREAPAPPVQNQVIKEVLEEALGNGGDVFEQPTKAKNRNLRVLISRGITAGVILTAIGMGVNKVVGDDSEPAPKTQSIDSIPNTSFDNFRLVSKTAAETKKDNPKEIFDNAAEKGVISERNTILISREEYQKIAPPLLNAETPEQINILFPIQFPDGLNGRKIKLQKHGDWMGGGVRNIITPSMNPNAQTEVAKKIDSVFKDSLTIKNGLKDGDMLVSPASGTISSGGTITGKDQYGNPYTIMMGGYLNLEYIKEIPPSRSEKVGPGQYRTIESHVPIEQGEPIGIIRNPSKGILGAGGSGGFGQFQMLTFSTVVAEDGTKQRGAANIIISASPEDKVYALK